MPGRRHGGGERRRSHLRTGELFTQHFGQGGTLLSFDPVKSQEYFRQLNEEGKYHGKKNCRRRKPAFRDVHNQALGLSTAALKQANEELKATIATLQNQLEQSKKDRKYAVAAIQGEKAAAVWTVVVSLLPHSDMVLAGFTRRAIST